MTTESRNHSAKPLEFRVVRTFWIAGDGQPCPAVEVWLGESLRFQHDFRSPEEELFLDALFNAGGIKG